MTPTKTHQLLALEGRTVEMIDSHGRIVARGKLQRREGTLYFSVGTLFVTGFEIVRLALPDIAHIAGTVIELR